MGSDDLFHRRKAKKAEDLARRKAKRSPYAKVLIVCEGEKTEPYYFEDLKSYLSIYYAAMGVLQTEQDFYELAYHYFLRASEDRIVYVEPFFDPQGHTARGVAFATIIEGIHRAQVEAADFSREEIMTLNRNAFETSWLSAEEKAGYLERVDAF